jgi:hypothetical protein
MWRRGGKALSGTLLAVTLSMTTGEFIEVQKLSLEDLKTRFKLPASCEPSLTALNTDPGGNQMTVAIECRERLAPPPPSERRERRTGGKSS